MLSKRYIYLFLSICVLFRAHGQDSTGVNKDRLAWVVGTESALYAATMIGLNELWYKDYPRSNFQHFNDNAEWLQMDKVGHAMTAYYVGLAGMDAMQWAGVERSKARWYGGGLGWAFLTGVEVLDGFSEEWGFSSGDMIANTLGMGMLVAQDMLWQEQRVIFKFSFAQSPYSALRPDVLGNGWREEVIKDYNGQTYWLSANIHSFLPEESTFPRWLNIAAGYGGEGLIYARSEFVILNETSSVFYPQYRQFYLSPDLDLWRIPTQKKGLKTALKVLGFIKWPLPALVLERGKVRMQGFKF